MSDRATWTADARVLLAGTASGTALVLDDPLSFWGGLDAESGRIIDQRHPQRDSTVGGRVLVMRAGRGSSSSSTLLAEAIRNGCGPAAIVLAEADEIVVLGALVAGLLDGASPPVVVAGETDYGRLLTGDAVTVAADGRLTVESGGETPAVG
ncbi:DUF126 domain-containing protein [soil metagenome]